MNRLKAILAAILILFLIAWLRWTPWKIPRAEMTPQEKAQYTYWHNYHGITGSICEGNVCWFVKDGKQVRFEISP